MRLPFTLFSRSFSARAMRSHTYSGISELISPASSMKRAR